MALASATVWELNASGTAANACGGGFNPSNTGNSGGPGTDYTLLVNNANYPAAKYNFSDLLTTNGTTNPSVVSSVNHSFTTADCGNIIHILSGGTFLAGWYEIVSVSGGAATLDRAVASGASTSSGVYQVGGALSLNSSTAGQTDSSFFASAVVAGNTIWMKNGSYTAGITFTSASGTITTPIFWHGYNSTRGDVPQGANRPTMNMAALAPIIGSWTTVDNIIFTGTAASVLNSSLNVTYSNLKVTNTSTTAARAGMLIANTCIVQNCEVVSYRGMAINDGGSSAYVINSYLHDSDIGINMTTGFMTIAGNIIADCVTAAINTTGSGPSALMLDNTLYGAENKLGIGIKNFNTAGFFSSQNNIIYGFTTGTSLTGAYTGVTDNYNDYFNCTTPVTNVTQGPNNIAINPQFANMAQLTGSAGVVSGSTLVVAASTNVVANQDFVYIVSGTGATAGKYLITNVSGTTLTLSSAPGGSGTNIVYQITTGHNFSINANLRTNGFPGAFPGALTTGYLNPGAVQPSVTTAYTFSG